LQDPQVVKVMHDCRADSDALFHQHNVAIDNVFDTQVAHALHEKVTQGWGAKKRSSLVEVVKTHSPQSLVELKYPIYVFVEK
jgi:ribonuclease D